MTSGVFRVIHVPPKISLPLGGPIISGPQTLPSMLLEDLLVAPDSWGHGRPPAGLRAVGTPGCRLVLARGQETRSLSPPSKVALKGWIFKERSWHEPVQLKVGERGSIRVGTGTVWSFIHPHAWQSHGSQAVAWNIHMWPFHVIWASAQPSSWVQLVSIRQGVSQAPKYHFHHTLFIGVVPAIAHAQGKNTAPAKQGVQQSPRKTHSRPESRLQPHGGKIAPTALMSHQHSLWVASKPPHFRGLFAPSDQTFSSKYRLKNLSHLWGNWGQIMAAEWAPVRQESSCNVNRVSEHPARLLWDVQVAQTWSHKL